MSRMIKKRVGMLAAGAVACLATAANAETVKAYLNTVYPATAAAHIVVNGTPTQWVGVGQLIWNNAVWYQNDDYTGAQPTTTTTPASFWSYCIQAQPSNDIQYTGAYAFKVTPPETTPDISLTLGADKATALSNIFGWASSSWGNLQVQPGPIYPTLSPVQSMALQLAAWEIIYDGTTSPNLAVGNFHLVDITNLDGSTNVALTTQVLAATNEALTHIADDTSPMPLHGLTADSANSVLVNTQDQIITFLPQSAPPPPTPLPASAAGGLALLAANAIWYWKRRNH